MHAMSVALVVGVLSAPLRGGQTVVDISGEDFLINGQLTYSTIPTCPTSMHGLLFNVRSVNATFDDLDDALPAGFLDDPGDRPGNNYAGYGTWDPDANTDRFIAALPAWRARGVLAVTLNFQGGCSCSRNGEQGVDFAGDNQTPNNNPYGPNGTPIDPDYLDRMARCINALDANGMVCILGLFYFGQDQRISNANDSQAVKDAVDEAVDWVLANDWRNVVIEINNETTVGGYQHNILTPSRVHELFQRVKTRSVRPDESRLLVSASSTGTSLPPETWMQEADLFLPHGNGLGATQIGELVADFRAHSAWQANPRPICFNEDSTNIAKLNAAAAAHASWGLYDDTHHQSVWPANWTIWSSTNIAFFDRVAELVGLEGAGGEDMICIPAATYAQTTFQGAMTVGSQYTSGSSSPPDDDPDEDSLVGQCVYANTNADDGQDAVVYTVNIPNGGAWYAWGRFYYPGAVGSNDSNSFWISVDGGTEYRFGNNRYGDPSYQEWHWDGSGEGESGVQAQSLGQISAGTHQVKIRSREADTAVGPRVDMLLLTNNGPYVPTDEDALAGLTPQIELSRGTIEQTMFIGDAVPDDGFSVSNCGTGTLHYSITEDSDWLTVSPTGGDCSSETDPIVLSYAMDGWTAGTYSAAVTVSCGAASNSPQTVTVNLTIATVSPDLDGDGDVDQADFGLFQTCYTGSGIAQNDPACLKARLDDDDDVDVDDFAIFQVCLSGAGCGADRTCDD